VQARARGADACGNACADSVSGGANVLLVRAANSGAPRDQAPRMQTSRCSSPPRPLTRSSSCGISKRAKMCTPSPSTRSRSTASPSTPLAISSRQVCVAGPTSALCRALVAPCSTCGAVLPLRACPVARAPHQEGGACWQPAAAEPASVGGAARHMFGACSFVAGR